MRHENYHESNFNVLHGTRGLYTRGAGSCHATVDGSKFITNSSNANRSAILISLSKIIGICNEHFAKTHCQTGKHFTPWYFEIIL